MKRTTGKKAMAEALGELIRAIARGDVDALALLEAEPLLATMAVETGATRSEPTDWFLESIRHHVYQGDTALHVAAAAYRAHLAKRLLALGADVHARNRRGATALHYACDGGPSSPTWDPRAQGVMVKLLVAAGAEVDGVDKGGVAPLHRAVRNRCTAAVKALLGSGADPRLSNGNGSKPLDLAEQTTGRSGSGTEAARVEQRKIVALLRSATTS